MATEVNKNKKWNNKIDVTRRRKKSTNETSINGMKSMVNLFLSALKAKHM